MPIISITPKKCHPVGQGPISVDGYPGAPSYQPRPSVPGSVPGGNYNPNQIYQPDSNGFGGQGKLIDRINRINMLIVILS